MPPSSSPVSQWLDITNFTPGIVSNYRAPVAQGTTLDSQPGTSAEGTFRCMALQTGQLVPLPALSATLTADLPVVPLSGSLDPPVYKPVGLWSLGPLWRNDGTTHGQSSTFQDEIHVAYEFISSTGSTYTHNLIWAVIKAYMPTIPAPTGIFHAGTAGSTQPILSDGDCRGMSHAITRARDADFTYPGYPCVFTEWGDSPPYDTGTVVWYVWPDPTVAGLPTDTPYSQVATFDANGIYCATLVGFQGRVVFLLDSKFDHGLDGQFLSNEQFGATNPINSLPPTNSFASPFNPSGTPIYSLDPELPGGYGSWGSISFGELMLIKRAGGAIHVLGDLLGVNALSTRMPGVTSTGNLVNAASRTPLGFIYCVADDGAYMWNGDNTSRKVSKLSDRFYDRVDGNPKYGISIRHAPWGDWVVFPNNWLYDTVTDAWWQLEDPTIYTSVMVAESMSTLRLLYAVDASGSGQVSVFDRQQPASSYTWMSQPIVQGDGSNIDINYVEIAISHNESTASTVQVSIEQTDGSFPISPTTFQFNVASSTIQRLRMPCAATNVPHIRLMVTVTGDPIHQVPAPVLNGIRVQWTPSHPRGQLP